MKDGEMYGGSSPIMNKMVILLLFFFLLPVEAGDGAGAGAAAHSHDGDPDHDDECMPTRCGGGHKGLEIRFPFWLKGHQPDRCGIGPDPGFALTCSLTNPIETLLDNPFSFNIVVKDIDYRRQLMLYKINGCVPHQKNLSLVFNTYPFKRIWSSNNDDTSEYYFKRNWSPYNDTNEYHIFSCPSVPYDNPPSARYDKFSITPLPCLSNPGHNLYLLQPYSFIWQTLLNCTKIYTFQSQWTDMWSFIPSAFLDVSLYGWDWNIADCSKCEEIGRYCRLSSTNNSKNYETECFDIPKQPRGESEKKSPLVTGLVPSGIFLLAVLAIATYFAHRSNYLKKEDQENVERFLENYRALKPTRYTYAEIKKITNNLKDKLGQGGYGTVYKGELSNDAPIAAKILDNFTGNGDDFINEMGTIGTIHHVNVVRLVGYCADGYKRALVYEFLPNDSLDKFISSDNKKASLGWEKLQDIALGIAKGIEYLHQGCDQRILHFDIKPHNILLDKNFIPKISDFGLAKLCSKDQSAVSMTVARGTVGYIAPEVFSRNFGNVSHKSDVYSFGMLLLEMVGGRKKNIDVRAEENSDEVYFPEWIYHRLSRKEINNNEVEEGEDAKIVKKLTIVGLWCIQWYPGDRPSVKTVVQMLEGHGETLAMPPNPFSTTNQSTTRGKMGERPFSSILEIISESD